MEIHQLRYMVALSQELNFGRAARVMHITQPTLSQQIKKLEDELGVVLFERSHHGVRVTSSGTKFLQRAIAALEQIDASVTELSLEAGHISGHIKIAAIPTMGPYVLPRLVSLVRKTEPKLSLELYEETTSSLVEKLKEGILDLGVLSLPIGESGLAERTLGREAFFLAVSKRHAFAKKKTVSLKDISRERLLILQEGHCFSDQALDFCKRSREDEQIVFQGSSLTSVLRLAAAGEGVTPVPAMAMDQAGNPDLRFIPFSKPTPMRELGMVWRLSTPLTQAHHYIIDQVDRILKK